MENNSSKTAAKDKPKVQQKKQYFDKKFKKNLTKALKTNHGEPGNIEKIQSSTKVLREYSTDRIAGFLDRLSDDVQKSVDSSLHSDKNPNAKHCSELATFLASVPASDASCSNNNKRCDELTLALKLCSESYVKCEPTKTPAATEVDFVALNKFLYTAVSGNPDVSQLNEASCAVLHDTLRLLNEQVDAAIGSHQFVDDLQSKLFQNIEGDPSRPELSRLFQNPKFNPLSLPLQYFVHDETVNSQEAAARPLDEDDERKRIKVERK